MAKAFTFTPREVMEEIAEKTGGRCLLAFSRGKDAIATWLTLRESGLFAEIVPFHLNLVPGLRFIEDSLDYFEDVFQTRIIRLPHISFYRMIGAAIYQTPDRLEIIRRLGFDRLTRLTYNDVRRWLAEDLGWPEDSAWVASGVRAADSPRRRIHIVKSKAKTFSSKQFYPIFDLNKQQTLDVIQRHGVRLPVDYNLWGRSFDGIDYRFVGPLKKHMPEEYERLRFWFPLTEKIGMTIEEMRACVFFLAAWRCIGNGAELRARALALLPADKLEFVPPEICEEMSRRINRSLKGMDTYEWVDRAVPGYLATLNEMQQRFSSIDHN